MRSAIKCQKGLTIVELLVVLAVLAIISSIMIASFADVLDRSRQHATLADMRIVARTLEAYVVDHGRLPEDSGGLNALTAILVPTASDVLPVRDHWGHAYRYTRVGTTHYTLESYGKDGVDGENYDAEHSRDPYRDLVMFSGIFVAAPND